MQWKPWQFAVALLTWTLAACGGGGPADTPSEPEPPVLPDRVVVTPALDSIMVSQTAQYQATVFDTAGAPMPDASVSWFAMDTLKARIVGPGLVLGLDSGVAVVRARSGYVFSDVQLAVRLIPVWRVTITGPDTMLVRDTARLVATAFDSLNRGLGGRERHWRSADAQRAEVTPEGVYRPLRAGVTQAMVEIDGVTGGRDVVGRALVFDTVVAGAGHTCGLERDRTAWCWGVGATPNGWLPPAGGVVARVPMRAGSGQQFLALTAGNEHTCGLDVSGRAWCWGLNLHGELGVGDRVPRATPTAVLGGRAFSRLVAGGSHTCGLEAGGSAWCWGRNREGQLGVGDTVARLAPAAMAGGLQFTELHAGSFHSCGLVGARAYCTGTASLEDFNPDGGACDADGHCGIPTPVLTPYTFERLLAGGDDTCGTTSTGALRCWALEPDPQPDVTVEVPGAAGLSFLMLPRSGTGGNAGPCGLDGAGQPWCWDGVWNTGPDIRLRSLASGAAWCGQRAPDGMVVCWGINEAYLGRLEATPPSNVPAPIAGHELP